jgi:hypothetical protein
MTDPVVVINRNPLQEAALKVAPIKTSEPLTIGGLVSILTSSGRAEFSGDAVGLIPAGIVVTALGGDNSAAGLTGNSGGTKSVVCRGSVVVESVVVTGVASVADIGKAVYATDGQVMTLTPTSNTQPSGVIVRWRASTTCDVYLFSYAESLKYKAAMTAAAAAVVASAYLTVATAASTYLASATAASTYLTITDAASTYLTSATAASTYLASATAASTYLTITDAANTYALIGHTHT